MTTNKNDKKESSTYNSEVTEHDKKIIGEKTIHIRGDKGDDTVLYDRSKPVDFAAEDLDIPGREQSNKHVEPKLKSEENQHHSLGSTHNEELEQDEDIVQSKNDKI